MPVHVKVLGGGCANCHKLEANARAAAAQLGIEAMFESSGDPAEYFRYGLLVTPGLVINDRLVSGGRVLSPAEITTLLADALA
jgi:small redox-active disulfide protein 2